MSIPTMAGTTNLTLYLRGWRDGASLLRRPIVVAPFLLLAFIRLLPLLCVSYFSHPLVSGFSVPVVRSLFGEAALHYPQHIQMLSGMYRSIDIALLSLVGVPVIAWAVFMMADLLERKTIRLGITGGRVLWSTPALLVIGVLLVLLSYGIPFWLGELIGMTDRPKLILLMRLSALGLWVLLTTLVIYSFFFLSRGSVGLLGALARSIRFARARFEVTVSVLLTFLVLQAPSGYLVSHLLVPHVGQPDPLMSVILLKLFFDSISVFYLFAATTSVAASGKSI